MKLITEYSYHDENRLQSLYESKPHLTMDVALEMAKGFLSTSMQFMDQPGFRVSVRILED